MYFPFLDLNEWVKIPTAQPQTIYSVFPYNRAYTPMPHSSPMVRA